MRFTLCGLSTCIANNFRVIAYHRRGFAGSSRACAPFTIGQQAADGCALLRHLGIPRAHIAGHSYGAAIALQWALDAPEEVQSLALLEAPLVNTIPSGPSFWEGVASVRRDMYERGDKVGGYRCIPHGRRGTGLSSVYCQVLATWGV